MSTTISPNMNLPVPVVGDEAGPQYAIDINACMAQLDAHDHTSGNGVQITPSGLNINADLPFSSNNATNLRSARFTPQVSPITGSSPDLGCLYVSSVDLYYNDVNGNQVRITQSGGVAGTPGSISNLTSPASASYVALSETFVWQSDANEAASMDFRSAILRNSTASSYGLTLQAPTLASDYTLTLPTIPGSNSFMTLSSSGVMGAGVSLSQGIVTSMIADLNVTTAKINDLAVTTGKLADGAVTQAKRAALGQALSNTCATFTDGSTTFTNITNLSLSVTTTGRPVCISIQSDGTFNDCYFQVQVGAVPSGEMKIRILRGATEIARQSFLVPGAGNSGRIPANMVQIDAPSAGTYTYTVQGLVDASNLFTVANAKLSIYEL